MSKMSDEDRIAVIENKIAQAEERMEHIRSKDDFPQRFHSRYKVEKAKIEAYEDCICIIEMEDLLSDLGGEDDE